MKKYRAEELYVVEYKNGNDTIYLICKRNLSHYTYIDTEILTNEKLDYHNVLSRSSLYSYDLGPLTFTDYCLGKPMLDKKEILRLYIKINMEARLKKYEELSQNNSNDNNSNDNNVDDGIDEILEKATLNFFPKDGTWYSNCFGQPEDLSMGNLPCHLRDDLWLAKMLRQNQRLFYISTNRVLQFVKTSPFFKEKRHEYELEIVKWQIDWMRSGGENWICREEYGGDICFLTEVCDLGFRQGVVDTLSNIGMNNDAIE